jgi:hypothetical protein
MLYGYKTPHHIEWQMIRESDGYGYGYGPKWVEVKLTFERLSSEPEYSFVIALDKFKELLKALNQDVEQLDFSGKLAIFK